MLKLKLQYFGHLMRRADSFEKTLMLGEIEGRRRSLKCSSFLCSWPTSTHHSCPAAAKSFQLCPTLCDPLDGSPPGSPFPGILQARTLEWV